MSDVTKNGLHKIENSKKATLQQQTSPIFINGRNTENIKTVKKLVKLLYGSKSYKSEMRKLEIFTWDMISGSSAACLLAPPPTYSKLKLRLRSTVSK